MNNRFCTRALVLLLLALVSGCATVNDKALRMFSAQAKAYALVNGQVLHGVVDLLPDRTGSASLVALGDSPVRCAGVMRYTGTLTGTIVLRCNDGSVADLQLTAITETTGFAYGQSSQDNSSLTYGLQPQDAMALLRTPTGKKLTVRIDGEGLELQ